MCLEKFTVSCALKAHVCICMGERAFSCEVCDKKFTVLWAFLLMFQLGEGHGGSISHPLKRNKTYGYHYDFLLNLTMSLTVTQSRSLGYNQFPPYCCSRS